MNLQQAKNLSPWDAAIPGTAQRLYDTLLEAYGPQGWWPVISRRQLPGYDVGGYHPAIDTVQTDVDSKFEIACGAILTQNTAWTNVVRALAVLERESLLHPTRMLQLDAPALAAHIHSAGAYNQKAKRLLIMARTAVEEGWFEGKIPDRERLLSLHGIGPETADSILLYAFGVPSFVVDVYTRRLLARLGIVIAGDTLTASYADVRFWFMSQLPNDVRLFNEFHALIVRNAKEACAAKPRCLDCLIGNCCKFRIKSL